MRATVRSRAVTWLQPREGDVWVWAAELHGDRVWCLGGLGVRRRKIADERSQHWQKLVDLLFDPLGCHMSLSLTLQIARRLDLRYRSDFHPLQFLGDMALSGLVHESAS